jgi:sugar O-acyltransferase (sialic acid O-acetyltransferase NeuD family)
LKKIIIIGASGHAKVIIDIIEKRNEYRIIGLVDSYKSIRGMVMGYPILGNKEIIPDLIKNKSIIGGVIAIGDNWMRSTIKDLIFESAPSFQFLPAIHPKATLYNGFEIEDGVVITAGAIVNSEAKVGKFCIINTNASLGHESVMQDFSSLSPNVTIGGNCTIGNYSAICIGAVLIQNIKIGNHSVIGASSLIVKDIADNLVVYGVPSKIIRPREIGDQYLSN